MKVTSRITLSVAALLISGALVWASLSTLLAASDKTCPWNGSSDAVTPTNESVSGSVNINGLPALAGTQVELRPKGRQLASSVTCFKVLYPGWWGISSITNGSQGFYPGEQIEAVVDGFAVDTTGTYHGDGLGRSFAVDVTIPHWDVSVSPSSIERWSGNGSQQFFITITNTTQFPSYFATKVADNWNWNGCVWPTTSPENVLRAGQSMKVTFSVSSYSCAAEFSSAFIVKQTHPRAGESAAQVAIPIVVHLGNEPTPTTQPTDAPTPTLTFVPTQPTSTSEATPTGDVTSTPGATPTEGATATDTPAATPTEGATATNTPVATPTLVASPTSPVQPTNTPVPSTGWLEIQPAAISHTVEYVSAPLVITWAVKNVSGQATSFTAIMLQPVGRGCFSNPSFQSALAVGETKAFSSTVSSTCLGAGTHNRTYHFVEQVPISATPRNANLPIQITVLPNPWEVKIAVPGAISATMPATYTMVVKNVGDRVRLGSAQVYVDSSPFAITPTVQVNSGEIHASPFGPNVTRYLWAFEIQPGETATFTSGGISKDIPTFTLYPDVWRWQSPDLSSGAAALAVFPQGQQPTKAIYLPVVMK